MEHKNEIAIKVLRHEYTDYDDNSWHYDREYKMLVEAQNLALSKESDARTSQDKALNLADVSASLLPENVSIKDLKDVRQYFRIHDKTMREHKAFATIHCLIEHIESASNAR